MTWFIDPWTKWTILQTTIAKVFNCSYLNKNNISMKCLRQSLTELELVWLRQWLGTKQAIHHNLNQWWPRSPSSLMYIVGFNMCWLNDWLTDWITHSLTTDWLSHCMLRCHVWLLTSNFPQNSKLHLTLCNNHKHTKQRYVYIALFILWTLVYTFDDIHTLQDSCSIALHVWLVPVVYNNTQH